jgi:hypothetical protein
MPAERQSSFSNSRNCIAALLPVSIHRREGFAASPPRARRSPSLLPEFSAVARHQVNAICDGIKECVPRTELRRSRNRALRLAPAACEPVCPSGRLAQRKRQSRKTLPSRFTNRIYLCELLLAMRTSSVVGDGEEPEWPSRPSRKGRSRTARGSAPREFRPCRSHGNQ